MKTSTGLASIAAAAFIATPTAAQTAQDERRPAARKACADEMRCPEPRRVFPWYYRGQDEGAQERNRRRGSAEQRRLAPVDAVA